ncbi:ABC transporter permease subunit [Holospora curviuscula]|uniref:Inner membrane ABC transporter permease protein YejE n=1 Tax=Holospora curviuscula TaxID=1082868 RepID=A0A2S5RI69_9PROT|nr:ABC transporter permease subunit [Holospora curviuscula]PPE06967.1 Inner membrane ABC transporter permease protein YejE [Holospora curviuscula]
MNTFWHRFKTHKKGFWALCVLIVVMGGTFSANFWANDKPLLILCDRGVFFPVFRYYPETCFMKGEDLEMDYLAPEFSAFLKQNHGRVLWPLYRHSPYRILESHKPVPSAPCELHPLGTDEQGRDVLARLVYGTRTCLMFGLWVAILGTLLGLMIGALQGYWGGRFDLYTQRLVEIWAGLPVLFMLMIIASFLTPSLEMLTLVMALFNWRSVSAATRAEFLKARGLPYVLSAKVLGATDFRTIWRHILPNATVTGISQFPFLVNAGIASLTSLDFLGVGLKVGTPSIGELLQQAKSNLYAPWLGLYPLCTLATILILVTLVGEGVRDALDPGRSS